MEGPKAGAGSPGSDRKGGRMQYVWAFLTGGIICSIGQVLYDKTNLTPAHVLILFTVTGAILSGLGLYEPLIEFAGAGALVPVSGFGSSITSGIIEEAGRLGWEGMFTGAFELTGLGVTVAVLLGVLLASITQPKG